MKVGISWSSRLFDICLCLWQPMLNIAYRAINWQQASLMLQWCSQSLLIHTICLHWFNSKCYLMSQLSKSPTVVLLYDISTPIFRISWTHWGHDEIASISLTTFFKCIFMNETVWISFEASLKFVLKSRINNIPALVQIMYWCRPGDNHDLNQWLLF